MRAVAMRAAAMRATAAVMQLIAIQALLTRVIHLQQGDGALPHQSFPRTAGGIIIVLPQLEQ